VFTCGKLYQRGPLLPLRGEATPTKARLLPVAVVHNAFDVAEEDGGGREMLLVRAVLESSRPMLVDADELIAQYFRYALCDSNFQFLGFATHGSVINRRSVELQLACLSSEAKLRGHHPKTAGDKLSGILPACAIESVQTTDPRL